MLFNKHNLNGFFSIVCYSTSKLIICGKTDVCLLSVNWTQSGLIHVRVPDLISDAFLGYENIIFTTVSKNTLSEY